MAQPETEISKAALSKSARGSVYNVAVSAITISLGFVRSVLLMRFLAPEQFGMVALGLFFTAILTPFSTLGIDSALIQRRKPRDEAFSTHFVLRLVLAFLVLGLAFLTSPLLRRIYAGQAIVVNVLLVLLMLNVLEASFSTPSAVLRRDMRFGAIALLNLLSSVAMTITAPLMAYFGAGLWSLVAEQAVARVVRWVGFWGFFRPWRLSVRFDWDEAKKLLGFGRHVFSATIFGILLDRFDDFWTGTVLGPTALGYYSRAYEVAQYPERVLATPITNVFFSTYAAVQEKTDELAKAVFRSSSFLVRAGFLIAVVLLIVTPEVTEILFGETWLPIVPVFRLMLVYVILDPMYVNLSYLIIGVGRPDWLARVRLIQVAFFAVTVVVLGHLWGINGVAVAADLMMLSGTAALLLCSRRFVRVSLPKMLGWPTFALLVSLAIGYALIQAIRWTGLWQGLFFKGFAVLATYSSILYLAERHIIHEYGSQVLQPLWSRLQSRTP